MDSKLESLINIDDYTYAQYTFLFENLNNKISDDKKAEYINKSIECAIDTWNRYKYKSVYELMDEYNLKVEYQLDEGEFRNLFGLFTYPNQITIYSTNIYRVYKKLNENGIDISEDKIKEVVLAHELFHYLENKDSDKFYTKCEKITTFKLFGHEFKSRITALSEIAAMNFAKRFTNLQFSTYVFDYLLLESIDKEASKSMFDTLMDLGGENNETNNI